MRCMGNNCVAWEEIYICGKEMCCVGEACLVVSKCVYLRMCKWVVLRIADRKGVDGGTQKAWAGRGKGVGDYT